MKNNYKTIIRVMIIIILLYIFSLLIVRSYYGINKRYFIITQYTYFFKLFFVIITIYLLLSIKKAVGKGKFAIIKEIVFISFIYLIAITITAEILYPNFDLIFLVGLYISETIFLCLIWCYSGNIVLASIVNYMLLVAVSYAVNRLVSLEMHQAILCGLFIIDIANAVIIIIRKIMGKRKLTKTK